MSLIDRLGGQLRRTAVTVELDDIQVTVLRYRPEPYFGTHALLHINDAHAGRELLRLSKNPPVNILLSTHWTMGAVRHGEYVAKLRLAPTKEAASQVTRRVLDPASAPEVYRPALVAELQEHPYEYDLQVQLCVDLKRMPVEDLTVEWPEALAPFVTVAKVRVPQQDLSEDKNLELQDATSITPWRVTQEHRPLGNLMRMRKEVNRQSSILRHELNHQIRREPRNLAEVFGSAPV